MIESRQGAVVPCGRHHARCTGNGLHRVYRWVTISGLVLAIWAAVLVSIARGAEFSCGDRVLIDYARALKGMPKDRLPDQAGLPFGPSGLELKPGRSIIVKGEPVSYVLMSHRAIAGNGHLVRPASLGWTVVLKLVPVNSQGRPRGVSEQRRWQVKRLRYPERRFELPTRNAGFYRVSVTIQKEGGATLANYRQFIRVLPLRGELSIRIRDGGAQQPGETVGARIENLGTLEAVAPTGTRLTVEHLEYGLWKEIEVDEPSSVMFEDPEFIPRGRASQCSFFTIPAASPPGAYRFSAIVQMGSGKPQRVSRKFSVL